MTSVDKLQLQFELCNSNLLRILFENVHFPNVSTVQFGIGTYDENGDSEARNILLAVFPNTEAFPSLTNLTLNFYNVGDFFASENRTVSHLPDIPLSHIPKLEYLDINTSFFVPEGHRLPAIRSMVLRDSYTLGIWLFAFLRELDAQGDLGSLQSVHFADGLQAHNRKGHEPLTLSNDELRKIVRVR